MSNLLQGSLVLVATTMLSLLNVLFVQHLQNNYKSRIGRILTCCYVNITSILLILGAIYGVSVILIKDVR